MGRAAQIETTPAVATAQRVDGSRRPTIEVAAVQRTVAVDFAPLIAPYKKHGRLTLRVERLAPKARFSKGSRNNDGASWSLASDELEDLTYQLAEGHDGEHTLAIRVIGLTNGNTLAVIEHVVSPHVQDAPTAVPLLVAAAHVGDQEAQLRAELAIAKEALAARDAELAQARLDLQHTAPAAAPRDFDGELAAARAAWNSELEQRLAAAASQAAAQLQRHREAWAAEQSSRSASTDAVLQVQLTQAREAWTRDAQDTLAKAEASWTAEAATRLAAVEAKLRESTAAAAAEAQARTVELNAARGQCAALQTALGERESALARSVAAANEASARHERDVQTRLAAAETAWKSAEAARFADAQMQWRTQTDRALAEVRASSPAVDKPVDDSELRGLRDQVANLQSSLADREGALARASKDASDARARIEREAREAMAKAEAAWRQAEAERIAALEAQWRERAEKAVAAKVIEKREDAPVSANALAEMKARCEAAEAALAKSRSRGNDVERLQNEIATLRAELMQLRPVRERIDPQAGGQPSRIRDLLKRPDDEGAPDSRRLVRDVMVVVALGVVAVLFYPTISSLIFGEAPAPKPAATQPVAAMAVPALPPAPAPRVAEVLRDAKLRKDASAASAVSTSISQGAKVEIVEERDKWTLVRVTGGAGKSEPQAGWIKSSLVKELVAKPGDTAP